MPGTPPLYIAAHSVAETAACVYEEVSAVLRHSGSGQNHRKKPFIYIDAKNANLQQHF